MVALEVNLPKITKNTCITYKQSKTNRLQGHLSLYQMSRNVLKRLYFISVRSQMVCAIVLTSWLVYISHIEPALMLETSFLEVQYI